MGAGDSARAEGLRLLREADGFKELEREAAQRARNYLSAARSEASLAHALRSLDVLGWRVLEDRLWPGSRRANVDLILVGPGGVVVVDAKAWREVHVEDGSVHRGQDCVDDDVEAASRLVDALVDGLTPQGVSGSTVRVVWAFTERSVSAEAGLVTMVGSDELITWLASLPHRFAEDDVARVARAVDRLCPAIETSVASRPARLVRPRRRQVPTSSESSGSAMTLPDVDTLSDALIAGELDDSIESWMTFLHPDQVRLTRGTWNGAGRIRGAAGTGKTVVGLHRATYLALRSPDPVLFVSYVRTLPAVFAALARRLSEPASRNIEFTGVHRLASSVLRQVGRPVRIDTTAADTAYHLAWARSELRRSDAVADKDHGYWRDEIDHVIKGRGITDFDVYRDLQRVGRVIPVRLEARRLVWDLYQDYERELERRGIGDFNDQVVEATRAVQDFPSLFRYSAVVVDEVQDLNLVAVRFLDELSGDGPNRLLVLGDSRQSVYPGGFTLAEAGISVAGRAHVLRENYRNTAQIVAVASAVVATDTILDIDGVVDEHLDVGAARHGPRPVLVDAPSPTHLEQALLDALCTTIQARGRPGNIAVLCRTGSEVRRVRRLLATRAIACVGLEDYAGESTDEVKVGTIKRAKGLEFGRVLLADFDDRPERRPGESDEAFAERSALRRRELYVGMTRARDRLWVGHVRVPQDQQAQSAG